MNLLHVEADPRDATRVRDLLSLETPGSRLTLVSTRTQFLAELVPDRYDAILCAYHLPGLEGPAALQLALSHLPDTPFLFLADRVGEEVAVALVRAGAADYLLKEHLHRLPLALRHALHEHAARRQRFLADQRTREQADLLDQARDGIIVTDIDDRITLWNHGATRLLGWSAAETIGHPALAFYGNSAAADFLAMRHHVDQDGEWHGELRLENKQHQPFNAEIRASLIRDPHGAPKSRLLILTDITEKKSLEAQFLRAQRLESLGMLAAGIAHDLNNILAPVLMGVPLLRSLNTTPAELRVLEAIEKSASRGSALVRQILSFAHGSSGQKTIVQPKHLLRDLGELIQQTFPKNIALEITFPAALWPLQANPTQLHQVLLNLCVNARDAMPAGGRLLLSAHNQELTPAETAALPGALAGAFVVLAVEDTGTGISPENLPLIWDPFFTTKGEEKGTGLGLSTVRGITASLGGFTTVESTLGRGTTFRIYLPAADHAADPEFATAEARPPEKRGRGELILVVDDEDAIRSLLSALLRRDGYHVVTAANGAEAAAIATTDATQIKLLITDLAMPEMGGRELAAAVQRINPGVKVLFMSGVTSRSDGEPLPPSAPRIKKPFTPETLLARVRTLLDTPAAG